MSVRSFQGAEIYDLASEMLIGGHSATIVRDTSVKKTGVASWDLTSARTEFFETAKTKAATDVIAACSMWFRLDAGFPNQIYRICTAGDNGGNNGRWYIGQDLGVLKIYTGGQVVRATGSSLSVNTWYHLMLMDDGTTAYVYLDGNTTADASWVHSQGAWNNKSWGPSAVQLAGKTVTVHHWFDDVVCFDDQDGRMDWITPSGWDGSTTFRVERAIPIGTVVGDFDSTGDPSADHHLEVDEDVDDTADYLDPATHSAPINLIAREDGTDYTLSNQGWGFTYDVSPASNEWTDGIWDAIAMGSEHIRGVRYMSLTDATWNAYIWRDTVLIGPDDPVAPAAAFVPRVMQYY